MISIPSFVAETQSSYRQIFKATSLFGGVQILSILISIVRTKFVAIFLGTTGAGVIGLLNAPLQLIQSVTSLGINFAAVRDISEAKGENDPSKSARAIATLRRWSWVTGLFGVVVTLILSPLLSKWTFGNNEYTWAFIWLSCTLLFQTISKSQSALLQGTRRLKDMAKASVYGSLAGLFTAVPLYYFFGMSGIVPSLIITAFTGLLLTWHFSKKIPVEPVKMTTRETFYHGGSMVKLGLILTVTGMIGFLTGYVLNAFIGRTGGVDQVGLYNAGWTIIGQSTGMVFAAMSTDYFPRLSSINKDNVSVKMLINQQAEMVLLILAPILIFLLVIMPVIIRLFYTPAFLAVVICADWMVISILLKGLVWPVGFLFPAKGDLKAFGLIEIISLIFDLASSMIGYNLFGLEGLGISFVINYIFGLTITLFFAYRKYGFMYDLKVFKEFTVNLLLMVLAFVVAYVLDTPVSYFAGSCIFIISLSYSLFLLNNKIGLKTLLDNASNILKKK